MEATATTTPTSPLHDTCVTDMNAPTFDADWQRRAFGVAVALSEFGHYPWDAFQQRLIAAIGAWEAAPATEQGSWQYYEHWLAALERVLVEHDLVADDEMRALLGA
ncbi:nitrile hydratase accessory protein [Streptomyces sp. Root369]|jgi:nitrile hydratase accessory protein|uniref:nitrile hydratase accessory protein n=1 Tax=Streptomyces TaxID=1883 RepID=UPI00070F1839|nr:nitrile hydratase accessory protein [Streptomyces sp. Root369]KQW10741.1 nitrile hydratase [Streptomyces sp. Root369]